MKKKNYYFSMLLLILLLGICSGCGKDDKDEPTDMAAAIAGRYSGELISGGDVVENRCFVEIVRYSESDVKLTLESDDYNLNSIIMKVNATSTGYEITSEKYSARGTIRGKTLNFYYSSSNYSYTFSGDKQ